jgi:outer membrane protein TolC
MKNLVSSVTLNRWRIQLIFPMRVLCACLFVLISALPSHASAAQDEPELMKILEMAAVSNPNINAAKERVNQAKADLRSAIAGLGPSLSGGVSAAWGNEGEDGETLDAYNAALNLTQVIWAGGSLTADKRAANLALLAARSEAQRTYQSVMNGARTGYYDCKRALARLRVAEEGLELSKEHLRQTEALHKSGMVPRGDVLRVQISVSQGEIDRIGAENELEISWTELERVVGVRLQRDEILNPISEEDIKNLEPPEYVISGDVANTALSRRAEIKAYGFYESRAKELIRSAEGQRLPSVTFSSRLTADDDDFWPREQEKWRAEIGLQWVLYDGGEISSRIQKAKAAARELLFQIENLSAQVRQEAMAAEINLNSAAAKLKVAEGQMATAEEDYAIALRRYNAQMGTNLDVLDARAALTESLTAFVNAVYDIAAAQAGLIYAVGEDMPPDALFDR